MARIYKDYTGQKHHRLTFLEFVGRDDNRNARWKVRCDCGTIFEVTASNVLYGSTYSCGCYRIERCKTGLHRKHQYENRSD